MENDNKSFETLAGEALDKVAGGTFSTSPGCCECGREHIPLGAGILFDPKTGFTESVCDICEACIKTYYGSEWTWIKY